MGVKSSFNTSSNVGGVDVYVDTAYDTVRSVSENLDALLKLNGYFENLGGSYLGELASPPSTGAGGVPLVNGDHYLNTSNRFLYTYIDSNWIYHSLFFSQASLDQAVGTGPFNIWVAYADDNIGTGISTSPAGKSYLGFVNNQITSTVDITDPSIFQWHKALGIDGVSSYTHIAYANSADGSIGFNTSSGTYLGQYVDATPTDSGTYTDYNWVKIKGDKGDPGIGVDGVDGTGATVVDNGNGTKTITAANGSVLITDGTVPTITTNPDGSYDITSGIDTITISDGSTPLKGTDYYDGNTGDYVSFAYANVTTGSVPPTVLDSTGSWDGTTEIMPLSSNGATWTDSPQQVAGQTTYITSTRYAHDAVTGTWSHRTAAWHAPAIFIAEAINAPQVQIKGFSFKRSSTPIVIAPTGGSFNNPTADTWFDGIPTGTLPIYVATATFTSDGLSPQNAGTPVVWGTPTLLAESGQGFKHRFSDFISGPWSDSPTLTSAYMITSTRDSSGIWVDNTASVVKIKGETGVAPQAQLRAFSFKRSAVQGFQETPTGGSFASPTPVDGAISGWSDGIPPGTDRLYVSTRIFTSDGASPHQASWATSQVFSYTGDSFRSLFSVDGLTSWHQQPTALDEYMQAQTSIDGGVTWVDSGVPIKIKGEQGPPGAPGSSSQTIYTWIKYADDASGTGITDLPTGKAYLGISVNQTSPTESTNPLDYTWSLIAGSQGVAGADGTTTYTWVKYGDNSAGAGLSDSPTGKLYIGLAFNKTTATESLLAADYQWALFRGSDGIAGQDGSSPYTLQVSANAVISVGAITTTTASTGWISGGYTSESFPSACYTSGNLIVRAMLGLSTADGTATTYTDINFAVYRSSTDALQVYELGVLKGTFGTAIDTDIVSVIYNGVDVKYTLNGAVFYTSTATPISDLRAKVALGALNAAVTNIVFGPIGEPGIDGIDAVTALPVPFNPGVIGGSADLIITLDYVGAGLPNPGEIWLRGSKFDHPDGVQRTLQADSNVTTTYGEGDSGKFYLMWSDTAVTTRFPTGSFGTSTNIVPIRVVGGSWVVFDNAGTNIALTIAATDCIIAVVSAESTSGGLSLVVPYVSGAVGIDGIRGTKHYYATVTSGVWADAVADAHILAQGDIKQTWDVVTISDTGNAFSSTRYWDGSAWVVISQVIDGNLIVTGTLHASKIQDATLTGAKFADAVSSVDWEYTPGVSASGWRLSGTQTSGGLIEGSKIMLYDSSGNIVLDSSNLAGSIYNQITLAGGTADWTGVVNDNGGKPEDYATATADNNLFVNGWGELGSNAFWSGATYDLSTSASGISSFSTQSSNLFSDKAIPIDITSAYELTVAFKSSALSDRMYLGIQCLTGTGQNITVANAFRIAGEDSTLYSIALIGDTTVKVVPGNAIWDTSNDYIQLNTQPDYSDLPNFECYAISGVDTTNPLYVLLTLSTAVTANAAAGSACGRSYNGGTYTYALMVNELIDNTWQKRGGTIQGFNGYNSAPSSNQFRLGTKYIKFMALPNRLDLGNTTTYFDNITLTKMSPRVETVQDGATAGADWNVDIINLPPEVTDGRITAGLNNLGEVIKPLPQITIDNSNLLRFLGGGIFNGDLNASYGATWGTNITSTPVELTDGRITTGLNNLGDVIRPLPPTTRAASNLLEYTGGATFTGDLAANLITDTNQITDTANLGGTAVWSAVSSKPPEVTDGRIVAGLAANGDVARVVPPVRITQGAVTQHQGAIDGQLISNGTAPFDSSMLRVQYPGGGTFSISASNQTGAIKIRLPVLWTSTMMSFRVSIFDYSTGKKQELIIAGYNYAGSSQWSNVTAIAKGTVVSPAVYFGHDGVKACVWIGELSSIWQYPKISVSNFEGGYAGFTLANWGSGWGISLVTAFDTIQIAVAEPSIGAWNNLISRPPELTDGRITAGLGATGDVIRPLPVTVLDSSNVLRNAGGGLYTGALDANNISNTNQLTDGAGLGSSAIWGSVSGRPAELTDGRISAGLGATGDVIRPVPPTQITQGSVTQHEGAINALNVLNGPADANATAGATWGTDIVGLPAPSRLYNNLIDPSEWVVGSSGTQGSFSLNGSVSENNIILDIGPSGLSEPLWRCGVDAASDADGGWVNDVSPQDGYNNTKTYRFTVWAKQTDTSGTTYLGCNPCLTLAGAVNANPYFFVSDLPQNNKWYLIVGVLHGSGYTGASTSTAGVYDPVTGLKALNATEFKADPAVTTQRHRAYLFYSASLVNYLYFAKPRMDEINGNEPSINDMLGKAGVDGVDGAPGADGAIGPQGNPGADGAAGTPGADAVSNYQFTVYKRSATAPATPTGGSYNFTTSTGTAPAGWLTTIPATDGNPLYASQSTASVPGSTGTDASLTWSTPGIMAQDGQDGLGANPILNDTTDPITGLTHVSIGNSIIVKYSVTRRRNGLGGTTIGEPTTNPTVELRRNGVVIDTNVVPLTVTVEPPAGADPGFWFWAFFGSGDLLDTPGTGSHTYTVTIINDGTGGTTSGYISTREEQ